MTLLWNVRKRRIREPLIYGCFCEKSPYIQAFFRKKTIDSELPKVNLEIIVDEASRSDTIVYASGVGKAKNPVFQKRALQVLEALKPMEKKFKCLTNKDGTARLMHPLTPIMREWVLDDVTIQEAMDGESGEEKKEKRPVGRPRKSAR